MKDAFSVNKVNTCIWGSSLQRLMLFILHCSYAMICRATNNNLELVVKIGSYFAFPDGEPQKYIKRQTLPPLTIDSHAFGMLQLVDYIGSMCIWGSKQYISLYHSWETDYPIEIKTDEQLLECYKLNLEKRVVHIHGQINDFNGPLQFSPTKRRCHPKVRKRAMETPITPPLNDPAVEPSQPTQDAKPTNKPQKSKSNFDTLTVMSDSSYDTDLAASSDSDSDHEYDPEGGIVDEDDGDDVPVFSYDADDPCIDVGVVFQNTNECKSAVTHHAILNDHAFEQVKKDKKRFRAKCKRADKGCKWQFYASTSPKYIGCKVNSDLNYTVAFILC